MRELTPRQKIKCLEGMKKKFLKMFSDNTDWNISVGTRVRGLCEFFSCWLNDNNFSWPNNLRGFSELDDEIHKAYQRNGVDRYGYVDWKLGFTSRVKFLDRLMKQLEEK